MVLAAEDLRGAVVRMLGRFESPGCCPGTRAGRRPGPDCSGGERSTRWRKRVETREFRRSLLPERELDSDECDCVHGCNGDCLVFLGESDCWFTCHTDLFDEYPELVNKWRQFIN